jgi:hypothetical protein
LPEEAAAADTAAAAADMAAAAVSEAAAAVSEAAAAVSEAAAAAAAEAAAGEAVAAAAGAGEAMAAAACRGEVAASARLEHLHVDGRRSSEPGLTRFNPANLRLICGAAHADARVRRAHGGRVGRQPYRETLQSEKLARAG